ncbi:acetoin utilization protein AcuC [Microtetraspora sp. NBRC 13810]|uniref:acetoin utilization protein AcuC n=1 Tax=Microtetraspora sp. NBRC 13810 TaxID=3030990 RepID=UPI0025549D6E|nr:acetoin utilization protein AcuC [Microtetraspora sp. NBRC 13810]GLW08895.1 acetoin utilization protein AcuC [Microtetraspora sp. NBRC 13810]
MSRSVRVVWDDKLTSYDFGPGHPLAPVRVELTMALARELGVLGKVEMIGCVPASDDELALVHSRDYIEAVKRVSADGRPDLSAGLGTPDNPAFAGVHEASSLVAGASLAAAKAVWSGEVEHAVNVAGGLHHAMPSAASGFCVYNDPGVAIGWMLAQGASRIAYVDVDVHHGDGVQAMFYDDPRVLTISLHETGRTLFPGTGFPEESGAEGTAVNVALPAGCGDGGWLRAFHAVVPPLLREFAPEVLVTQHGCDSHALDPLAHLMLSLDGQRTAYAALHELAHETAGGRWVVTGGGGYELVQVVPRAWTHLIAEAAGHPVDPATPTPQEWREFVQRRTRELPPLTMTDGRNPEFRDFSAGYDPGDPIDRAIVATRNAVFPSHGLDPLL